jgi:hypothetical protein
VREETLKEDRTQKDKPRESVYDMIKRTYSTEMTARFKSNAIRESITDFCRARIDGAYRNNERRKESGHSDASFL